MAGRVGHAAASVPVEFILHRPDQFRAEGDSPCDHRIDIPHINQEAHGRTAPALQGCARPFSGDSSASMMVESAILISA